MCTFPFPAGVTVINKTGLPLWFKIAHQKMMNDAVAKMSGKDFSLLWTFGDKAGRRKDAVGTFTQFPCQFKQFFFSMQLKLKNLSLPPFILMAVEIGPVKVFNSKDRFVHLSPRTGNARVPSVQDWPP
jgi:hypothetical protein